MKYRLEPACPGTRHPAIHISHHASLTFFITHHLAHTSFRSFITDHSHQVSHRTSCTSEIIHIMHHPHLAEHFTSHVASQVTAHFTSCVGQCLVMLKVHFFFFLGGGEAFVGVMATPVACFAHGHRTIYKHDLRKLDISFHKFVRTVVGRHEDAPSHDIVHEWNARVLECTEQARVKLWSR